MNNGTAANFMFTEPLGSWRKVNVRQRRTSIDWAYEVKELLNEDYPEAEKVILVCDNLNTHKVASFYEAFEPKQARPLAERLEMHYTPKHGTVNEMPTRKQWIGSLRPKTQELN